MEKAKRILALLFTVLTVLALFASCGSESKTEETDAAAATDAQSTAAETKQITDSDCELDLTKYNFNSKFTMLLRSDRRGATEEFLVDEAEAQGDVVDGAVLSRQLYVEQVLGVEFVYLSVKESEEMARVRANVTGGLDEFDVACVSAEHAPTLTVEGILENWYDIPGVNLDKVWWGSRADMAENLAINGKLYMITGDASNLTVGKALCMYFNKNMLEEYSNLKSDDIYQEVLDGKWTIDRLIEISKGLTADVDGNLDLNSNDRFGNNIYMATIIDAYFAAFDISIITEVNGEYTIDLNTDRMITAIEKLNTLCYKNNSTYITSDKTSSENFFKNNHAFFTHGGMEWAADFRDMELDYGVIPYPKLNESQESYKTNLSSVFTMFIVCNGTTETEKIGAVMELLGAKSYETTTPAYYEIVLKGKSTRDALSWKMLDTIHDGLMFEKGFLYSNSLGKPAQIFRTMLATSKSNVWASFWSSNKNQYNVKLAELLESFS